MQINPVLWSEPLAPDRGQLEESIDADEEEDSSRRDTPTFEILEPNHSFLYSTISARNLQLSQLSFLSLSLPTTTEEEEEEEDEEEVLIQLDGETKEVSSGESIGEERPTPKRTTPCKRISYKIKRSSSAYRKLSNRNPIRGSSVAELASKFDKLCTGKKFILDDPKFAQIIKRVNSQNYSQGDAGKINRKSSIKMNIDERSSRKPFFRQSDEDIAEDTEHSVSVRAAIKIFEDRQQNDTRDLQITVKPKISEKKFSKSLEVIPTITETHADNCDNNIDNNLNENDNFHMPVYIVPIPAEKTIRSESAYEIAHAKSRTKEKIAKFELQSTKSVSPSPNEENLYDLVSPRRTPVAEKKILPPVPPKPKKDNRNVSKKKTEDLAIQQQELVDQEKAYEELSINISEATHSYEDIEQKSDDGYEAIRPLNAQEQNIYETLESIHGRPPPLPKRQEELFPPKLPTKNTYYKVHNHDETNSYEIIDTGDIFQTNVASEVSSENSYDTLMQLKWNNSGSNRGSLISCDQQSNSLYGRSIPSWTEDCLNYKADSDSFSDRSDDWSDFDDNEELNYSESTL